MCRRLACIAGLECTWYAPVMDAAGTVSYAAERLDNG